MVRFTKTVWLLLARNVCPTYHSEKLCNLLLPHLSNYNVLFRCIYTKRISLKLRSFTKGRKVVMCVQINAYYTHMDVFKLAGSFLLFFQEVVCQMVNALLRDLVPIMYVRSRRYFPFWMNEILGIHLAIGSSYEKFHHIVVFEITGKLHLHQWYYNTLLWRWL